MWQTDPGRGPRMKNILLEIKMSWKSVTVPDDNERGISCLCGPNGTFEPSLRIQLDVFQLGLGLSVSAVATCVADHSNERSVCTGFAWPEVILTSGSFSWIGSLAKRV